MQHGHAAPQPISRTHRFGRRFTDRLDVCRSAWEGPLRESSTWSRARTVSIACTHEEAERERVLRADEGSVRRKHLAQGISTLVANQSARAQMHDLKQKMDSPGVRVDASVTRGVKALWHRILRAKNTKARLFGICFKVIRCPNVLDNFNLRERPENMEKWPTRIHPRNPPVGSGPLSAITVKSA
ncbi:protein of unknown function (plasmid) [Cupriavidus taiwanensis]|uniref:Uncharacterized protein n=1 Tax=Cupriavidus taiwanensis TaxID=164546 RepID=A0A375GS19_9BURK|nr:hypothetical protein CBM2597_P30002 [Cupriavidus taiwanensis]SOZ95756.1 hypothetical protein CBM2598_P30002 [Cupriavidus taiwanensis]SPC24776.1 hypothetical protein CT19431_P70023 [Cupriavidus taiwanensis]SPC25303.1 hypothetical protein CBM2594_P30002 [Cupriavidus taiwanensis]SPD37801.1 protein of unknown function [Cupriavidus taiwanensis]